MVGVDEGLLLVGVQLVVNAMTLAFVLLRCCCFYHHLNLQRVHRGWLRRRVCSWPWLFFVFVFTLCSLSSLTVMYSLEI